MPKYFTRSRKLPFFTVFTLILRNSVKSLQLMLNEFVLHSKKDHTITASAFSQARKKLKHTAFIELNDDIVLLYYKEEEYKKLYGLRLLAFDGSKLTLPNTEEIKQTFGTTAVGNHTSHDLGEYSRATFEACYDVLNNIAVKSVLAKGNVYEVNLATEMLDTFNDKDLLIYDRGYASYHFFACLGQKKLNYLIRCPKGSLPAVQAMFKENSPIDNIATITAPARQGKRIKSLGLPPAIKVRLVKVLLSTGEVEVLATSLMDSKKFPTGIFAGLYHLRWGVETFFSKIKGRLGLENFTGKSVEAIKQDFWSTIFISNLETIMTEDIEANVKVEYSEKQQKRAINKAVSFNAIKNLAFEILSTKKDKSEIMTKLTDLFLTNMTAVRKKRIVPRNKISDTRSLNFQKRFRKHVF